MKANRLKCGRAIATAIVKIALLCAPLSMSSTAQQLRQPAQRPLTLSDLDRLEYLGEYNSPFAFSPDGKELAYVRIRPVTSSRTWPQNYLYGGERSDIWLAALDQGAPVNLTEGEQDGSGYFMPTWSPDGTRLAMLSTKGGNLRLWVWERSTGKIRMLEERAVSLQFWEPPFRWVSNETLICTLAPPGALPILMDEDLRSPRRAMSEWPKAWQGEVATASAVESGVPRKPARTGEDQLTLINTVTGKSKAIDTGSFQMLKLSPSKQHLAFLKRTGVFRSPSRSLLSRSFNRFASMGYQLMIVDASGENPRAIADAVDNVYQFEWSKDGRTIAVTGEQARQPGEEPCVFLYSMEGGSVRKVMGEASDPPALMWTAGNRLLIRTAQKKREQTKEENERIDWWAFSPDAPPRNLTAGMKSGPAQLFEGTGGILIGLTDGDLWQINPEGGAPQKLKVGLDGKVGAITGEMNSATNETPLTKVVASTTMGLQTEYYLIDLSAKTSRKINKPSGAATIANFNPRSEAVVLTANTREGTFLWLARAGGGGSGTADPQVRLLVEANKFLGEIIEGERRQIQYRSSDGQDLKGWLILPVNYRAGEKYPLITWVYPTTILGNAPPAQTELNIRLALRSFALQLLSARGYAVLLPSMPASANNRSDAYFTLTNGVLPAVDKVIEMGIADPKRLGLLGHSAGGFAVNGLITQTKRFQAAVSIAGIADLISMYGQLPARDRYTDSPEQHLFIYMYIEESPDFGFGTAVPPWMDLQRYIRNSPLFYADHIETPVMLIHGDMDSSVPLQQAEELFSALYRQNKRAKLVRYWGEGHVLQSPANIRDMWQQIFAWYDQILKGP